MKLDYFRPLAIFIVIASTGAIVFWPKATLTPLHAVGFCVLLVSVALTYLRGVRRVLRDTVSERETRDS